MKYQLSIFKNNGFNIRHLTLSKVANVILNKECSVMSLLEIFPLGETLVVVLQNEEKRVRFMRYYRNQICTLLQIIGEF